MLTLRVQGRLRRDRGLSRVLHAPIPRRALYPAAPRVLAHGARREPPVRARAGVPPVSGFRLCAEHDALPRPKARRAPAGERLRR